MDIRNCRETDVDEIRKFVKHSKPLDLHTVFTYWTLFKYFGDTCFVLEKEGRIIGFISGLLCSNQPDTLYLWQIGIDPDYRGNRYAEILIKRVVAAARAKGCKGLQITIAPENRSSYRLFSRFALEQKLTMDKAGAVDIFDSLTKKKTFENLYEIRI
jgi:L-2,4-diaminobutyric acid acetyltransferase